MRHARRSSVAVAIFAKAPIPGLAKTRLIPRLGEQGAANLQRHLIERAVEVACEADIGLVAIWCSPNARHDVFDRLSRQHQLTLHDQIGADLGARMHHAFATHAGTDPLLVMGTDCVVMTPQHLRHSADALLAGADVVLTPVEDGGYILIGLNRPAPNLFANMPWGAGTVVVETRARAKMTGLTLVEGTRLWDIDRVEDYDRAVADGYLSDGSFR